MTSDLSRHRERAAARPSVWHNVPFRRFWYGHTVSEFGDRVTELALPLIAVLVLHATPTQVGLLTAAVWAPNLLSLLVGSWADQHLHKRRILVAADLLRAVTVLSVPIVYAVGVITLAQLFVVALLAGLGQVLFSTSYPSFFVSLVPRADYVDANAKLNVSRSASFVAGPAAGGFLIQLLTAPLAMLVDAASFLCSAVVIARLDVPDRPLEQRGEESWLRRAATGVHFVVTDRYLRGSLRCCATINFFTFMSSALLVLFASRELGLSAGVIGLAFGIGSVGGLIGAFAAPRLSARFGVGRMIVVGAVVFPASIAPIALAGGADWVAAGVLGLAEFGSGLGVMVFDINLNSLQAAVIPDGMRSRVAGAFSMINYGVRPLGAVLGGVLGSSIGIRETLLLAAAGGVLSVLFLFRSPIPAVRSLDEVEPAQACPAN